MAYSVKQTSQLLVKIQSSRVIEKTSPRFSARTMMGASRTIHPRLELLYSADTPEPFKMSRGNNWYIADLDPEGEFAAAGTEINAWDACHRLIRSGIGIDGATVQFAEPDFEQQWLPDSADDALGFGGVRSGPPKQQDWRYNTHPDNNWFRDAQHSQLNAARDAVSALGIGDQVRIAHLDTGFDPDHRTVPVNLDRNLQKNFVEKNRPDDATDTTSGLISNPGHGTATLAILAGAEWSDSGDGAAPVGGAPQAHVVPIRVANSVILFKNSAIARALDYVISLSTNPATRIDVVTMSMGGVASKSLGGGDQPCI